MLSRELLGSRYALTDAKRPPFTLPAEGRSFFVCSVGVTDTDRLPACRDGLGSRPYRTLYLSQERELIRISAGELGERLMPVHRATDNLTDVATTVASPSVARRLSRLTILLFVGYLLIMVLAMLFEAYLIYPTWQIPPGDWNPTEFAYEDVTFESEDGTRLHGWFFEHSRSGRGTLLPWKRRERGLDGAEHGAVARYV